MKKTISVIMTLIILISASACAKGNIMSETTSSMEDTKIEEPQTETMRTRHEAYLIDDTTYFTCNGKPMAGWTYDGRGSDAQTTEKSIYNSLNDISSEYGTAYIREFNRTDEGVISLEIVLTVYCDDTYQEFRDDKGNVTYRLMFNGEAWHILNADGTYTSVFEKAYGAEYKFKTELDFDNGKARTYINNIDCGESALLSDNIINYRFGTDEEHTGTVTRSGSLIYANYEVYDTFSYLGAESVYGWTLSGRAKVLSNELNVINGGAERKFYTLKGNICAETYFLIPKNGDMTISLADGGTDVICLTAKNGVFSAGDKEIYTLTQNMWYRLHIEADLVAGKADIWLNGRVIATVDIQSESKISSMKFTAANAKFDNIKVNNICEADDYVPKPVVTAEDDYRVGMLSCNLWYTGFDEGWNLITAYDDRKPVLGYYDEGNPEAADWETKYMVEHGVDFQVYCWYNSASSGPLKTPNRSYEFHNGYMYSKYSSYLDYAIMWETSSGTAARVDKEQFEKYIVPYWFENYFLDDRYLVIDNKPVLYIFKAYLLYAEEYFGSIEAAAQEMEYLNNVAKSYGFDGILLSATGSESDISKYMAIGLDGMFSYGFGQENSTSPVISGNTKIAKGIAARTTGDFYMIPSISTGFNNIPFSGTRTETLSKSNFKALIDWAKNTFLPTYVPKGGWAENMIIFSNWNEYGEGKYIMPTESDRFMYLDVIRSELSGMDSKHTDVIPTQSQKERITRMFPQYQSRLYSQLYYPFGILKAENAVSTASLYINGKLVQSQDPALQTVDKILFPVDESTAVNYLLNSFMTWRKGEGTLKFEANRHTVIFTVGSNVYTVDGEQRSLKFEVYTFDGLVMLPFDVLAEALGYTCDINGYTYSISTN